MILVKFEDNLADEMDVSGFKIFDNLDAWNKALSEFKSELEIEEDDQYFEVCFGTNKYFEVCFGTNEYIDYDSFSNFLKNFEIIEISKDTAEIIGVLFPKAKSYGYGHFPV
jgi:hypothetical protein